MKDSAIVLHAFDYGESDRIIDLLTLHHGRVRAIAKGAKRSRRRFLNALEPFTHLSVEIVCGRTASAMSRIDSAVIKRNFPVLYNRYGHYLAASLCCELVSMWTREWDGAGDVYRLLLWYFDMLAISQAPLTATIFFKIYLLKMSGYGITGSQCKMCGVGVRECERWKFDPGEGGFICGRCSLDDAELTRDIPAIVQKILDSDKILCNRLKISDRQVKHIWQILEDMNCYHLGKRPVAYKLIKI